MELVFDCETTITPSDTWKEGQSLLGTGKGSPSPYLPTNELISIHTHNGKEAKTYFKEDFSSFQEVLDQTTRLIAFNMKFDLSWIRECGFKYDGEIYDTQLVEYVIHGGTLIQPSLNDVTKIYNIEEKKNKVKEYWEKGINTNKIPREILKEYGEHDAWITYQIYTLQQKLKQVG